MEAASPLCIHFQHLKKDRQRPYRSVRQLTWFSRASASWDMLWQLLTNVDVLVSLHILPTSLSSVNNLILRRSSSLTNLKLRNLTLWVNWLLKAIKPQNKKNSSGKNSGRGNSSSKTRGENKHSSESVRLLEIKAVKGFTRKSLTISKGEGNAR